MKNPLGKIKSTVKQLLLEGLSPRKISQAVCLGAYLGIFPVIGATTVLGIVTAKLMGLNQLLVQLALQAVYPLQIIAIIPFINTGRFVFGKDSYPLDISKLNPFSGTEFWESGLSLVLQQAYGVISWLFLFPVVLLAIFITEKILISTSLKNLSVK